MTHSALYEGFVRHRRHGRPTHELRTRVFQCYLDLAELPEVLAHWPWASAERPALSWLRRRDHFGDRTETLDEAVRALVARETGARPRGPIRLLTHLRSFGLSFNPVSFFYCFDAGGARVETILAEVDNTPWGERHVYVLSRPGLDAPLDFSFDKAFHVSPFMPMQQRYRWRFGEPSRSLAMHLQSFEGQTLRLDATFSGERRELTRDGLRRMTLRYPAMTARVLGAIYLNALRLWLRGAPFFEHPAPARRSDKKERPGVSVVLRSQPSPRAAP